MSVADPCILWGVRFGATAYNLAITANGSTDTTNAFAVASTVTDCFASGDGQSDDLCNMLQTCIRLHANATAATVTLTSDYKIQVTNATAIKLLWSDPATTLDATVFGWVAGVDSDSGTTITSPNVVKGIWRPKRPASDDGRNTPMVVGGIASSISGKIRVSSMVAPADAPRERTLVWRNLVQSEVVDEYTEADDPFGSYEYAWRYSLSRGYGFRYYEDETACATRVYDLLRVASLELPYARSGDYAIRWDVTMRAALDTAYAFANRYSLYLDGTDDYVSCGDVTTTDSLTKCTWQIWVRVPTSWPANPQHSVFTKYSTNQYQWGIFAGAGAIADPAGRLRVLLCALTDFANGYWTSAASAFAAGTWYHVVVVYDGAASGNANRLKIYRNATEITGAGTFTGTIPATTAGNGTEQIRIGCHGAGSQLFTGYIADPAIWAGTALTTAQVAALYAAAHPASLVGASDGIPNPTHWWTLENNYIDNGTSQTKAHGTASGSPVFSTTVLP